MMALLVFRGKLRDFYGKYDAYLIPLIKLSLSLTVFFLINTNVGYMDKLKSPAVMAVLCVVCAFLPYGVMSFLAGAVLLAHISRDRKSVV